MIIILFFSMVLAVATVLPLVPWPNGLVRVCEFPRLQIIALAILLIVALFAFGWGHGAHEWILALLTVVIVAQAWECVKYTPLCPVQSLRDAGDQDASRFRILSANVKMSNRRFGTTVELARRTKPDIAIFMEVDDEWAAALQVLKSDLPHAVEWPRDNSYGMLVLSRLPLLEPQLRFLVFDDVPSIRTGVRLPSGEDFRLYAAHPEPPVPYEDTIGRDGELAIIASEVARDTLPTIVAGDLNDVAWSRTTRRFQRLSGLLDPRVGRGFFNTFDARLPGLRWPLDHLFHHPRFRLVRMERLPFIGSDHFPIMFDLVLKQVPASESAVEDADEQDQKEVREVVADANQIDRRPVGTDWEPN